MTTPDPVREAARERLKAFARQHAPGTCKMLSKGDQCTCPLCDIDNLAALSAPPPQVPLTDAQILQCAENEHLYGRAGSLLSFARKLLAASPPPNTPREE